MVRFTKFKCISYCNCNTHDALKDIIFAIGFNYIKCWKTCSVYVEGNLAAIVKQLTMNTKKCSFSKSSSSDEAGLSYKGSNIQKIIGHIDKNKLLYIGVGLVFIAAIVSIIY